MKKVYIKPIPETPEDWKPLEKIILDLFRKEIYLPLMRIMERDTYLENSTGEHDYLLEAIKKGRITYYRGEFKGKFSARITKDLKKLGAKWDRKTETFKLPMSELTPELHHAIKIGDYYFERKMDLIDQKLRTIFPEQVSKQAQIKKFFDFSLVKTDGKIKKSLAGITVTPKLTEDQKNLISDGYTLNLDRYIKDFTVKQIVELREKIGKNVLDGNRYEGLIKEIQDSYGVSKRKAEFLARQETSLMTEEFKKVRYVDAGSKEYKWKCFQSVEKNSYHTVRPGHWKLKDTIQKWSDPPVTNPKTGARNHPGCDFNCFCRAEPIISVQTV